MLLEFGLIRENSAPLAGFDVRVLEANNARVATTTARGTFQMALRGRESGVFVVHAPEESEPRQAYGFGTIRLVGADGASEVQLLAHGWIRHRKVNLSGIRCPNNAASLRLAASRTARAGELTEMFKTILQITSEGCEIIFYRSFDAAFLGASVASTSASWLVFVAALIAVFVTVLAEVCSNLPILQVSTPMLCGNPASCGAT